MDMYGLCDITEADFKALFAKHKTCGKVAKALGVSRATVNKYAKEQGLSIAAHRPPSLGKPKMLTGAGKVMQWIKDHPGEKLPLDAIAMAAKTGLPRTNTYSYLRYRKGRFEAYVKRFPPLNSVNAVVNDHQGRAVPLERIKEPIVLDFDLKSMVVVIKASLGNACPVLLRIPLKEYEALFKVPKLSSIDV